MEISADFLRRLAQAAAAADAAAIPPAGDVSNKLSVGFDPVTEADREAEQAIRATDPREFPATAILGEEFGSEQTDSEYVWVIDPIDGTRSFISGIPLWGTLIGLTRDGDAVAGMMAQPFTGELFYATASEAWYEGPRRTVALSTRKTPCSSDATLCTTTPSLFGGARREAYDRLETRGPDAALRHRLLRLCDGGGRPHRPRRRGRAAILRHRGADPDHRGGRRHHHELGRRAGGGGRRDRRGGNARTA